MSKEFVTYEQALALKELGFDEDCFVSYFIPNIQKIKFTDTTKKNSTLLMGKDGCTAPLKQQCLRWFREKYGLHVIIDETIRPLIKDSNSKLLFEYTKDGKYAGFEYEEAELACIDALIEIVKTNNEK